MAPNNKDAILKKSGVIHRYKCDRVECDEEYIGKPARNFAERFKEHLKPPSPVHDHFNISGHIFTIDNFSIVGREEQNLTRTIKEALYIRVNNPCLKRNIGKYHLPHIWDEVLFNISELKLKYNAAQGLFHLPPMVITPARHYTPTLVGYSICHHGNSICQYRLQPTHVAYHLPHLTMAITCATLLNNITYHLHCGYTINHIKYGNNICHSKGQ